MNTIITNLSEIESDLNYNIHNIIKNFLQIDNDNNNNLYLLDLNQLKNTNLNSMDNIYLFELIHTNINNINEIIFQDNLLITLGDNNNKNIFHFWEINNSEENQIRLINYLEVVYHQINKFFITNDRKYLICYCLDNTIQKIKINNGQLEKIFNINHWIFNSLPNYILDENRIIYCTQKPCVIDIKNNKINKLKLNKNIHVKKINYTNNNIYLFTIDQKIYQLSNTFDLKYIYDLSNPNIFEIFNTLGNHKIETNIYNFINKENTKVLKFGNQLYSNINFISHFNNSKYLLINYNNTILKTRNLNCFFSIKNIDLFNKEEKFKILYVIWIFKRFEIKINKCIPLEIIEYILSFTTLGDWLICN